MSLPSKLAIAIALPLVAYVALTAFWAFLEWSWLEPTQAFSLAKHLVVVLSISALLLFYSQVGGWVSLAWCSIVPFERYADLFREVVAVASGAERSLATIDLVRIVLLLVSLLLSAGLVFTIQRGPTADTSVQTDR